MKNWWGSHQNCETLATASTFAFFPIPSFELGIGWKEVEKWPQSKSTKFFLKKTIFSLPNSKSQIDSNGIDKLLQVPFYHAMHRSTNLNPISRSYVLSSIGLSKSLINKHLMSIKLLNEWNFL